MDIVGKTVFVTGAASGLGAETARALTGAGARGDQQAVGVAVVAAVVLVALVAGLAVIRPGPVDGWFGGGDPAPTATAAPTPTFAEPSPVLAAAGADGPAPTAAGVAAALNKVLAGGGLGPHVGISVVDVATGQALYERNATVPLLPASTTKIVTAAATLAALDPAQRIPTRVVAGSQPGEVVIIGGGDPTLAIDKTATYPGAARLTQLAAQVKTALGGVKPTSVVVDGSLYSGPLTGPGWDADAATGGFGAPATALMTNGARVNPRAYPGYAERFVRPDLAAGQAFAKLLGVPATAVRLGTAPAAAEVVPSTEATQAPTKQAGAELGRVESPPIQRLVDIMLTDSDNVVAEALARQVAVARGAPVSFSGAAIATTAVLAELGLPAGELLVTDGSGLSRRNRLTAGALSALLALAAGQNHPKLRGVFAGLPVAGWSGTLRERFGDPKANRAGYGIVRAKTGTLTGVTAMSGTVVTAGGRLLAFSVLADKVANRWEGQVTLDQLAVALARCGCQ